MENATARLVTCLKCGGTGKYHFWSTGAVEECYPCEGTGKVEESAPSKPARPLRRQDWRLTLRGWYRNARLPSDHPCHLDFAVILDQGSNGMGWTREGLDSVLDSVPGSREAFRALGWPV